jgi:hypothetical protein
MLVGVWGAAVPSGTLSASPSAGTTQTGPPENAAFQRQLDGYLEVRRTAAGRVPAQKETDTPQQISDREKRLGEEIRRERPQPRSGEVLGAARTYIVETIRRDWRKRTPEERAGIMGELPATYKPSPNSVYPTHFPLLTFPPALLRQLPPLPKELEYRFLGPHLILRDSGANLIVDVLPNVLTSGAAKGEGR